VGMKIGGDAAMAWYSLKLCERPTHINKVLYYYRKEAGITKRYNLEQAIYQSKFYSLKYMYLKELSLERYYPEFFRTYRNTMAKNITMLTLKSRRSHEAKSVLDYIRENELFVKSKLYRKHGLVDMVLNTFGRN
jgi:endonuclease III-like uncharacterized protein